MAAISRPTVWVWLTASGYSCWAIDTQSTTTTLASISRCITAETSLCIQLSKIPLICGKKCNSEQFSHLFSQIPATCWPLWNALHPVSSHYNDKFQEPRSTLVGGTTSDLHKEREDCKNVQKAWACVPSSRVWWRWSWLWHWSHTPLDSPSCQPAGSSPLGPDLNSFSCCTW